MLFLDFDRTLATTKSGASPLLGSQSVDPELAALIATHTAHVVTRNRHIDEIRTFLREQGVRVAGVHHAGKGVSKADAMLQVLPALASGAHAIFVDDDVRECLDSQVMALPGLLRVLFRRGTA